jgi:hypothetical protein
MRFRMPAELPECGFVTKALAVFAASLFFAYSVTDSFAADQAFKNTSAALPSSQPQSKEIDPVHRTFIAQNYGVLPLAFEANVGQVEESVRFLSRGNGYTLFLTPTEAILSLSSGGAGEIRELPGKSAGKRESSPVTRHVIRLKAIEANANPKIAGVDELPGKSHYFIGNDPGKWHTDVTRYAKARVENVYPGVDLVYYGNQRQLEYDWILDPGASPELIKFSVESEDDPEIDSEGNLMLVKNDKVLLRKPVIYQERNGTRTEIAGGYVLLGKRQIGLKVDKYDAQVTLVIDPVLSYSTYLGGNGTDGGFGIAVDSSGNAYITGFTESGNFPTATPYQASNAGGRDVFIAKLNASGSALVYSTYIGGSAKDDGYGIAVDSTGNAYVTGATKSTDFPTSSPYQAGNAGSSDVFVAKLNASGSALVYSTYIGGAGADGGNGVAVDASGSAYISGYVGSTDFPVVNAFQGANAGAGNDDAFVAKLNAAGTSLTYSTYLGGSDNDYSYGIAVDSSGNAYVTGYTLSTNFPSLNAFQPSYGSNIDAFVTKLNTTGNSLLYSTYLGGSGDEYGYSIAVDSSGSAYITGFTTSTNFPTASPIQEFKSAGTDAFLSKLNASGNALVYSTFLGGNADDSGRAIAVDASGNASITGFTASTDFPTVLPIQDTFGGGAYDAIVAKLNASGNALVHSTYLGNSQPDSGTAIAVDSAGDAYVTGGTLSTSFPTLNPFQPSHGGGIQDAFVTKISSYCTPGAQNLCLFENRFFVSVEWLTLTGSSGKGNAVPLTSDGGYFWFFENTNVELLVKIKDGRAVNGYFWVFWGAMTDVRYTITIRDTVTGAVKKVEGYQGQQVSGNDITAFFDDGESTAVVAQMNGSGNALIHYAYLDGGVSDPEIAADAAGDAFVTGGMSYISFPELGPIQEDDVCTPGAQNLCLFENRFFVEVDWLTLSGSSGKGNAVSLTSDGGYFWFFENTNVELLVKIKDGRAVNGYFWVFWGAMTDVRYTITIRDTLTGTVKLIEGYQGQQVSGNDIRAF